MRRSIIYAAMAGTISVVLADTAAAQTVAPAALPILAVVAQDQTPSVPPPAENPDTNQIGDIIVTAQKRSESISRVPMSISAASGDQLRAVGVANVGDLQKIVSGFRYTPSAYSTPIYSIRGIGFNESSLGAKPNVSGVVKATRHGRIRASSSGLTSISEVNERQIQERAGRVREH